MQCWRGEYLDYAIPLLYICSCLQMLTMAPRALSLSICKPDVLPMRTTHTFTEGVTRVCYICNTTPNRAHSLAHIVVRTWTGPDLDRGPGPRSRTFGKMAEGPGPAAYFVTQALSKQHAALMTAL